VAVVEPPALVGTDDARDRLETLAIDLDGHARVGDEVVIPGRVARRAAHGGDDDDVVTGPRVDERGFARLAALRAGGREDEDVAADERAVARMALVGPHVVDEVLVPAGHGVLLGRSGRGGCAVRAIVQ
jgi:hypothetical protein